MASSGIPRDLMAMRAAAEIRPSMVVNLGIGLPTLVAGYVPEDAGATMHSENGILGYGRILEGDDFDPDLVNAGGQPVELRPGASFFDSALSFAMIRGGHIDLAVLGGLQVGANGDLANWMVPERGGGSVGGAMDLAIGARRLVILMEHTDRDGAPRLLTRCDYPLTGRGCVARIITNLAVIDVGATGFELVETAPGVTIEEVRAATGAELAVPENVPEMQFNF